MLLYTPSTTPVNVGARASAPGEISHIPLAPPKTPDGEGVSVAKEGHFDRHIVIIYYIYNFSEAAPRASGLSHG